jgi:hypothetical protein
MYNNDTYNNIQQKTGQAQNVTRPPCWVTCNTYASEIMGRHRCQRYYGHHGCQRYYGSKVVRQFLSRFPPAGRHTSPTMLNQSCGMLDRRERNYVGRYIAPPENPNMAAAPGCPESPNMAAVPDRPTNGRGITSVDMLHQQTTLIWPQPLAAQKAIIWLQPLVAQTALIWQRSLTARQKRLAIGWGLWVSCLLE